MSSLFDDVMMGAKVANVFFKGAKKVGKLAAEGIQKVNESEQFQNMKADIQNRVANSETLNNVKNEVQQRFSQFTTAQTSGAKKHCSQCGAVLEANARFCSACGAKQEEPAAEETTAMEDDPKLRDPEYYEAQPTVLSNGQEEIPDIFGFQPRRPAETGATTVKRQRVFEKKVNKNLEPFTGFYRLEKPDLAVDLQVYGEEGIVCFEYYDVINGKHLYKFDDWDAAGNYLYCRAWDYAFKFIYHEDNRMELDTYDVYPGLSGFYRCLD